MPRNNDAPIALSEADERLSGLEDGLRDVRSRLNAADDARVAKRRRRDLRHLARRLDDLYAEVCYGRPADGWNASVATLSTQLAALLRNPK